jgi:hypothetical protein
VNTISNIQSACNSILDYDNSALIVTRKVILTLGGSVLAALGLLIIWNIYFKIKRMGNKKMVIDFFPP